MAAEMPADLDLPLDAILTQATGPVVVGAVVPTDPTLEKEYLRMLLADLGQDGCSEVLASTRDENPGPYVINTYDYDCGDLRVNTGIAFWVGDQSAAPKADLIWAGTQFESGSYLIEYPFGAAFSLFR